MCNSQIRQLAQNFLYMVSAKNEPGTLIQLGAKTTEMDHPLYARLSNGLCIVIANLATIHYMVDPIEEVVWRYHTIHGIRVGESGCKKRNVFHGTDGSRGAQRFNIFRLIGLTADYRYFMTLLYQRLSKWLADIP